MVLVLVMAVQVVTVAQGELVAEVGMVAPVVLAALAVMVVVKVVKVVAAAVRVVQELQISLQKKHVEDLRGVLGTSTARTSQGQQNEVRGGKRKKCFHDRGEGLLVCLHPVDVRCARAGRRKLMQ